MREDKPKSFDEHRQYLHKIVRLKLWFVWYWQQKHKEESFSSILRNRVDIYRKTDINQGAMNPPQVYFDDPQWLDLEHKLLDLYRKHSSDDDAFQFEHNAFHILKPIIDKRAFRDYLEPPYVLDFQCGSLKYDRPEKNNPTCVSFHIANALAPGSIFDDKNYLPDCLISLMDKSSAEYGADSLYTSSWLNSHPLWQKLFPEEWEKNMESENHDIQWHFGFWGQFITARGIFNDRLGRQLRETGRFPFLPRYSWCSFESLRNHLSEFL